MINKQKILELRSEKHLQDWGFVDVTWKMTRTFLYSDVWIPGCIFDICSIYFSKIQFKYKVESRALSWTSEFKLNVERWTLNTSHHVRLGLHCFCLHVLSVSSFRGCKFAPSLISPHVEEVRRMWLSSFPLVEETPPPVAAISFYSLMLRKPSPLRLPFLSLPLCWGWPAACGPSPSPRVEIIPCIQVTDWQYISQPFLCGHCCGLFRNIHSLCVKFFKFVEFFLQYQKNIKLIIIEMFYETLYWR